jgi:hypothetical protein
MYNISGGFAIPFTSGSLLSVCFSIQFNTAGIINSNNYLTTITSVTILNSETYKFGHKVTAQTSRNKISGTQNILLKNKNIVPKSYSTAYDRNSSAGRDITSAS